MSICFDGRDHLVDALDSAVSARDAVETVRRLRTALCAAMRGGEIHLPECVAHDCRDHYARHQLYRSPTHGYSVIAMTWGPGQGTPIHDHAGMWCVEAVWQGSLEVVQYELRDRQGDRYRFVAAGAIEAGAGSAGSLIPPHEHHTIRNLSDRDLAISVHVYEGDMTYCGVFEPTADGWHLRQEHPLHLDPVAA